MPRPVVPIAAEVLGDRETPVSVFEALVADGDGFLLESVEANPALARTVAARRSLVRTVFVVGLAIDSELSDPYTLVQKQIVVRLQRLDGVASVEGT